MLDKIESALSLLRQTKPLVLCLTNYVTMDFMANSLLALGAAPIMSCDKRELEELIKISHAINLNIGTLDPEFIEMCSMAVTLAKHYKKPIILDPVGAGASLIRTNSARNLMASADIIRGNASEVMALLGNEFKTLGVESTHSVSNAKDAARTLAKNLRCTVVVSGEVDFITDSSREKLLKVGSHLMPLVTGMGCTLTAVIAALRSVVPDSFGAATLATAYFGLCGNLSQSKTDKPGTFRSHFIDVLYAADFKALELLQIKMTTN